MRINIYGYQEITFVTYGLASLACICVGNQNSDTRLKMRGLQIIEQN